MAKKKSKDELVAVRMEKSLYDDLQEASKVMNVSVSWVIRIAARKWLDTSNWKERYGNL